MMHNMSWMLTAQGHEHVFAGADALKNDWDVKDVAHALALQNRFNGHTVRPYSVAEHSLLVAEIAKADGATVVQQLAALMHDAHEAYTGDVISPVQARVGRAWSDFEASVAQTLRRRYGLLSTFAASRNQIQQWDLIALATERRDLTLWEPERHASWPVIDSPGMRVMPLEDVNLKSPGRSQSSWQEWRDLFEMKARGLAQEVRELAAKDEAAAAAAAKEGGGV